MIDEHFDLTEAHRRIANLLRHGTVAEVRPADGWVRVTLDDDSAWQSDFLPVKQAHAGRLRSWSPPQLGEQVSVFSTSGETGSGVVLRGLNRDQFASPSTDPDLELLFLAADGAFDQYAVTAKTRTLSVPEGGKVIINVASGAMVTAQGDQAVIQLGSSTITVKDGEIDVAGALVKLAGGGAAVARIGDLVDLHTGKIISGSTKVFAG